jgi:Na+/H+-dicarboxylate symporter
MDEVGMTDKARGNSDVGFRPLAVRWRTLASGVPLPLQVLFSLGLGFTLGLLFPHNQLVGVIYRSGTYFPRLIVTLAALLVFHLLAAATAKLILNHRQRAGGSFFEWWRFTG